MFRTLRFYHSFFKFLSTPSARRATQDQIHHLWRGGHFYPRPPRGGRQLSTNLPSYQFMISIHALREEGDSYQQGLSRMWTNFYPRPPRGGRPAQSSVFESSQEQFLSTPSARRATSAFNGSNNHIRFLSTPSARRATSAEAAAERAFQKISIHALREEGDNELADNLISLMQFLSTPSARRATGSLNSSLHAFFPFLSTPSARRATTDNQIVTSSHKISIHALREEGDYSFFHFCSTPL